MQGVNNIRYSGLVKRMLVLAGMLALLTTCVPPTQHNILLLVLDDFGYGDLAGLRPAGSQPVPLHTPVLDGFLAQSVGFTRHYTESTCAPSRAALLSGRYPARFGFISGGRGLPPEITTLPEALSDAGYSTRFLGKWHTGETSELAWPHLQGFDTWLGALNQWRLRSRYDATLNNLDRPTYIDPWLQDETGEQRQHEGHLNDILRDQAIGFLTDRTGAGEPWFLQLSFLAPHEPVEPAERFLAQYPDTPEGLYRALVHQLDENIGLILASLEETGQADDTIVVIVSDNGGTNERLESNAPYRGEKWTYFEGGIRTPMMIRWPDGRLAGRQYPYAVSIMDLYPTLLASVGVDYDADSLDGRDLSPLLALEERLPRTLYWETVDEVGYLYSVLDETHRWRYSTGFFDGRWLFDLEADPFGTTSVLDANPATAARLVADYRRWHDDVHRLRLQFEPQGTDGRGILSGDDFQRSPGIGDYTFAIGVTLPSGETGQPEEIIVSQSQLLSMIYDAGMLRVSLQDAGLSAPLPADGRCHAVILTARQAARNTFLLVGQAVSSPIDLIVDGRVAASIVDHRELPKDVDLGAPTYIGYRPPEVGPGNPFSGRLSVPVLYNHRVTPEPGPNQFGVEALSDEVCPGN